MAVRRFAQKAPVAGPGRDEMCGRQLRGAQWSMP